MFELTEADIFRLVSMFASSDMTFMQVRAGDVDLVMSRNEQDGVRPDSDAVSKSVGATVPPAGAAAGAPPARAAEAAAVDPGLVSVDASTLGAFYRAPRPDLPPYVDVGSTVEADTTVGLIEAMKIFTGVTAGLRGTVVEVLVEDGQFVEYGQPLFQVRPSGAESAGVL